MGSSLASAFPHVRKPTQAGRYGNPRDRLKTMAMTPEQKKSNLRMALILASVAVAFFVGFVVKVFVLSR